MSEVVIDGDAARRTDHFETPLDAGEQPQRVADPLRRNPRFGGDGNRSQRVADIVSAEERHVEHAKG